MGSIDIWYANRDRFLIQVRGHDILVDQPVENGGDDIGPKPSELFVGGLGACVGFYAERFLRRHNLPAHDLKVRCEYTEAERPARIDSIDIQLTVPDGLPAERQAALEAVVDGCLLHNSLRQPPEVRIRLHEAQKVG